jgi:regulatory protein
MKITSLEPTRGRRKRIKVALDGRFAFSLETEVALKEALRVGQELSDTEAEALTRLDRRQRCLNAACSYLSYRPRSEAELRTRLFKRGFAENDVEQVVTHLNEIRLIDDVAFAQFWKDNRESFRPRSQRLTLLELRQKGVDNAIARQVASTIDDADSAYRAASVKARRLTAIDYDTFRRRLGDYLRRRGFSYGVASKTVERLWHEKDQQPGDVLDFDMT